MTNNTMAPADSIVDKWKPILEDAQYGAPITNTYKARAVAQMLENQQKWNEIPANKALLMEAAPENSYGAGAGNVVGWDPVLIQMLRRAAPQMIAYDICGVQPMAAPTGLIFAMKARYGGDSDLTDNPEALFDGANTAFAGTGTHAGSDPAVLNLASPGTYTTGTGMPNATGESLGDGTTNWGTMGLTIEKVTVTAKTRALRANYTYELQQDLRAVHGLDAEQELSNILSQEILFEINREIVRNVYIMAEIGAQSGTTTAGTFDLDVDSNGRWSVEKFKGLMFQLEREANLVGTRTRRGKANWMIVSPDVASALAMSGKLDYAPALQTNLDVDPATSTFCGVLNGRYKVFVDPYFSTATGNDIAVVGYKGSSPMDAGYFYSPYVPLEMYKTTDPDRMQPVMAFKTRYGTVTNPFANASGTAGAITANVNKYFRKVRITNIL